MTELEIMTEVLTAHQRISIGACGCGWNKLGRSFTEHQAIEIQKGLAESRVIADETLGVMAQTFYEASNIPMMMTDKPKVVAGLVAALGVLAEIRGV